MKKSLFLLIALCAITAMAQEREYRPFCEEGKVWITQLVSAIDTSYVFGTSIYILAGDTIINGSQCLKMTAYAPSSYKTKQNPYYVGAFYENQGRIYFYSNKSQNPVLKYDFTTPKDESFDIGYDTPVVVVQDTFTSDEYSLLDRNVEFVMTGYRSEILKELYPDTLKEHLDLLRCGLWREGVGNLYGDPCTSIYDKFVPTGLTSTLLISCSLGSDILFRREGYDDLIEYITGLNSPKSSLLEKNTYDLSGRKTSSPHAHGIYIEGGKKVVR